MCSHNHNAGEHSQACQEGTHCHLHHYAHSESQGLLDTIRNYIKEITTGLLLALFMVLNHFGAFTHIASLLGISGEILSCLSFIIALIPVGVPIVIEMFELWGKGNFMNEFTLMVAATVGAFIIGEFPEGVAVLLFYSFGEKLEDSASDDVKKRIKALIGKLPDEAKVKENGVLISKKPRDIDAGAVLVVKPGERVAIDGELLGSFEVDFDTSAITGESVPRAYKPGEEISSGMIPVDRVVEIKTLKAFSDSSLSRIMKLIESAQATKSPTENMLRRITRWYTPLVFTLAVLLFCIPGLISILDSSPFLWMSWLRRSLVFLVCSCPCALVVSIPLSYFASLGNASRKGLLFKGSKYVDSIRDIDTIYFDKTGTLTTGKFHISTILTIEGKSEEKILGIAAAIDAESMHPLAQAITGEADKRSLPLPPAADIKTVPHGMTGKIEGNNIIVGSRKLLKSEGIETIPTRNEGSEICVAVNGKHIGSIYLLDDIKPEATAAIRLLHNLGVKNIVVLSGDREEAVKRVARIIGADGYEAALLPADKQNVILENSNNGHKIAFVGDGINDAPSIAASDVGVAMGTLGTDMAMESADLIIAGDSISKLPVAIRLARKVRRVIIENVSFAMGIKAAVMILGAFGIASLWAAVFADTGVTLITICWTLLRLRK